MQTKGGQETPRGKRFTAEQIIGKLREAEVGLAQGKTVPGVDRKRGGPPNLRHLHVLLLPDPVHPLAAYLPASEHLRAGQQAIT